MRRSHPVNPLPSSLSPSRPLPPGQPSSYVGPLLLVVMISAGVCAVLFTLLIVLKAVTAAAAALAGAVPTVGGVAISLALRKRN